MKLRNISIFLFAVGMMIPLRTGAQTYGGSSAGSSSKDNAAAEARHTFTGTVTKVDENANKLTMKTWDNRQIEFSVDSHTALALGSTAAKFSELKAGQSIILTAEGNKALSLSLSTTDLQSGSSDKNQASSNETASSSSKNQGVDPYRSSVAMPDARAQVSGGTMARGTTSSEVQGLRSPNGDPAMPPAAPQATGNFGTQTAPPASSPSTAASEQAEQKIKGSVVKVDAASNLITLKTADGQIRTFSVDFATKYNLASAAGMLSDLKEGQQITITAKGMKALSVDADASNP